MSDLRPIKLIVAALGGQGGGVVSEWLIEAARLEGYLTQATSVPGVAQRTGATVYYLEFFPLSALPSDGRRPVLALMPHPGDVDVVVASEIMEAGRMLQRGVITRDRTTLIASSHRVYAIGEKTHMGDGRADTEHVMSLARAHSRRFITLDMQAVAEAHNSVISAAMLGSLAGSKALPFSHLAYRRAIEASGTAVQQSLAAFEQSAAAARAAETGGQPAAGAGSAEGVAVPHAFELPTKLSMRVNRFPSDARATISEGVRRLIDYQDVAYAETYLTHLELLARSHSGPRLIEATARGLALWMSFEDTIRVADLKIRAARSRRVLAEVRAKPDQLVYITEFMKPRVEEICGTLPPAIGRWILSSRHPRRWLSYFTGGRKISTSRVSGFLMLYALASMRPLRRNTLRFQQEHAHLQRWLATIGEVLPRDYDLAVEIAECQQLVKGYGDTHERGSRNFDLVLEQARSLAGEAGSAAHISSLRAAALADDEGLALGRALKTVVIAESGRPWRGSAPGAAQSAAEI